MFASTWWRLRQIQVCRVLMKQLEELHTKRPWTAHRPTAYEAQKNRGAVSSLPTASGVGVTLAHRDLSRPPLGAAIPMRSGNTRTNDSA